MVNQSAALSNFGTQANVIFRATKVNVESCMLFILEYKFSFKLSLVKFPKMLYLCIYQSGMSDKNTISGEMGRHCAILPPPPPLKKKKKKKKKRL